MITDNCSNTNRIVCLLKLFTLRSIVCLSLCFSFLPVTVFLSLEQSPHVCYQLLSLPTLSLILKYQAALSINSNNCICLLSVRVKVRFGRLSGLFSLSMDVFFPKNGNPCTKRTNASTIWLNFTWIIFVDKGKTRGKNKQKMLRILRSKQRLIHFVHLRVSVRWSRRPCKR